MQIVYKGNVCLAVDREVAIKLLSIVSNNPEFQDVKEQLETELKPSYQYNLKCRDCFLSYIHHSSHKLTEEEEKKGGLCYNCFDDYK